MRLSWGRSSASRKASSRATWLAFCAACDLAPERVLMVGDTRADLEMGRRAGCGLVVAVLTGGASAAALAPYADHVLRDVGELPALLALGG